MSPRPQSQSMGVARERGRYALHTNGHSDPLGRRLSRGSDSRSPPVKSFAMRGLMREALPLCVHTHSRTHSLSDTLCAATFSQTHLPALMLTGECGKQGPGLA